MSVVELPTPKPWATVEAYIPTGFILNEHGLYLDRGDTPTLIAGRCWVSALTRSSRGEGWGHVIDWIDRDGNHQQRAFPAQLMTTRSAPLADNLQALGLQVIPGMQSHLMRYLGSFTLPPNFRLTSVNRLGWLDDLDNDLVYVLPQRVMGVVRTYDIIFQPEVHCPTANTLHSRGSLEHWKAHVAALCQGHPIPTFALCAGLSGPLLKYAGLDSGGFHFFGASSKGKTTVLQIAASLWGNGADPAASGDSYIGRWNSTGNALEAIAASHNDGLLALDEMGTCDAKNFGKVTYDLLGGRGKSRLDKNSQLQAQREWRITALSTGEISVHQKIQDDTGKAPLTGQLIRMIDIPIHDGVFVEGDGVNNGDLANRLKQACSHYYGTAAPEFISRLINLEIDAVALQHRIKEEMKIWEEDLKGDAILESYQLRVLRRFALDAVTGCLAVEFGILPFTDADVAVAALDAWRRWFGDADNQPDAVRGVRQLKRFILQFKVGRFRDVDDEQNGGLPVRDLAGYWDRARNYYLFTDAGFREACTGHDWRGVLRELTARGFLFKNDGHKKMKSKHSIDGIAGRISLYAVRASLLEDDI